MKRLCFYALAVLCIFLLGCVKNDAESHQSVLMQIDRIGTLWTNDIQRACQEIKLLANSNPTSFFQNAEMCHKYVKFIDQLKVDAIPLNKRSFYVSRCFMTLMHPLYESIKAKPQNEAFRFMAHACYIHKLSQEYSNVCAQLEEDSIFLSNDSSPNDSSPFAVMIKTKEEQESYRKLSAERMARKNRLHSLRTFKFQIEKALDSLPQSWFDAEFHKEQIISLAEPQRTKLINYIEDKLGRKMKWRK